ncbi:45901_t:CDS:2, partial [Gigaspora margarita]
EHVEKRLTRNTTSNDVSLCGKGFVITGACSPFALIPEAILLGDGLLGTTYFDSIEEGKACELFEKYVANDKRKYQKLIEKNWNNQGCAEKNLGEEIKFMNLECNEIISILLINR